MTVVQETVAAAGEEAKSVPEARLRMTGMTKAFGPTVALDGVELTVQPGEIHALIGENGAGKSTLMKVLSGAQPADAGEIYLDGEPYLPSHPRDARTAGVAMIYQELNLAPDLSVEENLLLGDEPARFGWIDRKTRRETAREAMQRVGRESMDLRRPVKQLSVAEQQLVEIARACRQKARVVVLDEPTSSLTRCDVEQLFVVMRRLAAEGVSLVYISHFLEECREIATRFTVLRDGKTVGADDLATTTDMELLRLMAGRDLGEAFPRVPHEVGEALLDVKELAGERLPKGVSFNLRRGEIFGIAGLMGAGRTETVRTLFGLDRVAGGAVSLSGRDVTRSTPRLRLGSGIGLLSEDRKNEGLYLTRSLTENLTGTAYERYGRHGFIDGKAQEAAAKIWLQRLGVKARHPRQLATELSGGNQQKVAFGRLLHHDADIFLLDEPTRGIDVGSKAALYTFMGELAAEGKAVLFVSSYLPELLGVCDTIGVMLNGRLVAVRAADAWTELELLEAALGGGAATSEPLSES